MVATSAFPKRRARPSSRGVEAQHKQLGAGYARPRVTPICYIAAISPRIAVGLPPLHGLLTCGQFEMTTRMSISARSAIESPAFEGGASKVSGGSLLSVPAGTLQKKFKLATMSLRPRP